MRIHSGIHLLKDHERISAWVYRIARNVIADHFRRTKSREPFQDETEMAMEGKEEGNFNERVAKWLPSLLNDIPQRYREAVELFELQDISQQAIADRLRLTLSGAKSRVQRGRDKLKQVHLQCCHFEFDAQGNVIAFEPKSSSCSCCPES